MPHPSSLQTRKRKIIVIVIVVGILALLGLIVVLPIYQAISSLSNLFAIPKSSLEYVSVADWTAPDADQGKETTLLLGEASGDTGNAWRYRAIMDEAIAAHSEMRFGYHVGVFERLTSIPASSGCYVNGKPRGRSISFSVDGQLVKGRNYCRVSALDFEELWKIAEPVEYHQAFLPRPVHQARVAALQQAASFRLTSHEQSYSPYDQTIRVGLPVLWAEPAQDWSNNIWPRLESAVKAALGEAENVLEFRLSERMEDGVAVVRQMDVVDFDDPQKPRRYLLSGTDGPRAVQGIDLEAYEIRIKCVKDACANVGKVDFAGLTAPFRNRELLQAAYAAAPEAAPAETEEHRLDLDEVLAEQPSIEAPREIRYGLSWVELPQASKLRAR